MGSKCARCKDAVDGGIEALRSHWRAHHPDEWRKMRRWLAREDERVEAEEEALRRLDGGGDEAA